MCGKSRHKHILGLERIPSASTSLYSTEVVKQGSRQMEVNEPSMSASLHGHSHNSTFYDLQFVLVPVIGVGRCSDLGG